MTKEQKALAFIEEHGELLGDALNEYIRNLQDMRGKSFSTAVYHAVNQEADRAMRVLAELGRLTAEPVTG